MGLHGAKGHCCFTVGFGIEQGMKTSTLLTIAVTATMLSACTTEIGPNGQPRQVMTPMGAAAVQAITAAGIGAGTGALMPHMNSVAAGAISAGAGSVGNGDGAGGAT